MTRLFFCAKANDYMSKPIMAQSYLILATGRLDAVGSQAVPLWISCQSKFTIFRIPLEISPTAARWRARTQVRTTLSVPLLTEDDAIGDSRYAVMR